MAIIWTIGIIVLVIGVALVIAGSTGHALAGRRHYFRCAEEVASKRHVERRRREAAAAVRRGNRSMIGQANKG